MRPLIPILAAALALALPTAQAQDACTEATPCPWEVVVDGPGFVGESEWNWTAGDWMRLTVANDDLVPHTVALSGHGVSLEVPPLQERSQVVQLAQAGRFTLSDAPSGDAVPVMVVDGDVVDYEGGLIDADGKAATPPARGIPGLALAWVVLAVAAGAASRKT
ncbi:MAG TPA: hypothetical protein VHI93_05510 [Candidatus Thermoplasmatota archaeon]|nr:hypothetical protein [Candidatus Thermoplasmatota archaeon]